MKKLFFCLLSATALGYTACGDADGDTEAGDSTAATETSTGGTTAARRARTELDESASYIDLRTGQTIRVRRDDDGLYVSEAGDLGLFVNTATGDTFYRGEAYPVSGHLMRDPAGSYTVDESWLSTTYANDVETSSSSMNSDPDKVRVEDDGDYKVKNKDGDVKEKLKVDGDGKDMKYKYKDDATDTKVKQTEDQTKIKSGDTKVEIESDGSTKVKR